MEKHIFRRVANVAIAFAVIFFLYGLVRIIVALSNGEERLQAVGITLVAAIVIGSVIWVAGSMKPRD